MTSVLHVLKISHLETDKVHTTSTGTSVMEAAKLMRSMNIGALPVLDNGEVVGIITERDILELAADGVDSATVIVAEYMTEDPVCVTLEMDVLECDKLMRKMKIRHLPVLEKGKLIGMLSVRDVLYAITKDKELLAEQLEAYITGRH